MWHVWERRGEYNVLVGKSEGKSELEDLGVKEKIISKLIFKMWDDKLWTG
jgi:hypothetical protein